MNLKVIQVKYFLTWCIINLGNSSDTIKTKSLAGLKMDNKWQKLHKDRNVYREFRHLLKTICCLGLQKNIPCGKARCNDWTPCIYFTAVGRLELSTGLVNCFRYGQYDHLCFPEQRAHLHLPQRATRKCPKSFWASEKASELWANIEVMGGEVAMCLGDKRSG